MGLNKKGTKEKADRWEKIIGDANNFAKSEKELEDAIESFSAALEETYGISLVKIAGEKRLKESNIGETEDQLTINPNQKTGGELSDKTSALNLELNGK